jgi:hypothetical protein
MNSNVWAEGVAMVATRQHNCDRPNGNCRSSDTNHPNARWDGWPESTHES